MAKFTVKSVHIGLEPTGAVVHERPQCMFNFSDSMCQTHACHISIKGVKSEKVPLNFAATDKMEPIIERLQEIIVKRMNKRDKSPPSSPKEDGKYQPGPELADIVLELLREEVGEDLSAYDTDRTRLANDIEGMLQKAAKEWVKTAKE